MRMALTKFGSQDFVGIFSTFKDNDVDKPSPTYSWEEIIDECDSLTCVCMKEEDMFDCKKYILENMSAVYVQTTTEHMVWIEEHIISFGISESASANGSGEATSFVEHPGEYYVKKNLLQKEYVRVRFYSDKIDLGSTSTSESIAADISRLRTTETWPLFVPFPLSRKKISQTVEMLGKVVADVAPYLKYYERSSTSSDMDITNLDGITMADGIEEEDEDVDMIDASDDDIFNEGEEQTVLADARGGILTQGDNDGSVEEIDSFDFEYLNNM